eukprot:1815505-Rhodomonas_salina.1
MVGLVQLVLWGKLRPALVSATGVSGADSFICADVRRYHPPHPALRLFVARGHPRRHRQL